MNIADSKWSRIWSYFGRQGLSNSDQGKQASGPLSGVSEANIVVSDERAMQVSAVWSCVRLITETVGSLPLNTYERVEGGRKPADIDHPLVRLLQDKPNQYMNPMEMREALTMQVVLWGNGYALIDRIKGRPVSLIPLKPEDMEVYRTAKGLVYKYSTEKGPVLYGRDDIFHIKGFSPDGVMGLSPLAYSMHVLGVTVSADKFAGTQFASGGQPKGVLQTDLVLNENQREQVKSIYDGVSSRETDSRLWVLEGGMKYNAITIPPDQLQMLQSREFQLSEIARIYRVPSHLINDSTKNTSFGTGVEQMNLAFLTHTIAPYLERWEAAIQDQLVDRSDRRTIYTEHDVSRLLRSDSKARAEYYSTMTQNGIMTRKEAREKENLPFKEGSDELTVQVNLAPLDKLETIDAKVSQPAN